MAMLVDGKWQGDWQPVQKQDEEGRFERQPSSFRHWITSDGRAGPTGEGGFQAEAGRYHLYVALICPWASRALMVRALKGLKDAISVTVVEPFLTDQGWAFGDYPGASGAEPFFGARYLHEVYVQADPHYTGRVTVPLLWDKQRNMAVNNESADIIRMLNSAFDGVAGDASVDLYPEPLRPEIDDWNERLYTPFNNGVYRTGFAQSQQAYDEAVKDVFDTLDALEARLSDGRRYLHGDQLTETDIRAFATLVRFDAAYHGLFKCNLHRLADYAQLAAFTRRLHGLPEIRETVDLDHIKAGYYSIKALNPSGIVPKGPALPLGPGPDIGPDPGPDLAA